VKISIRLAAPIIGFAVVVSCAGAPEAGGCDKDYAALKAEEMSFLSEGEKVFRSVEEADATPEQLAVIERTRALLQSRTRPVDETDVAIIDRAQEILKDESVWDREDDRRCNEADTTFSLFCALYFASKEILGEYQHRRTGLQEVRFALEDATAGVDYEHRLRDFNNNPETTLDDVYAVLATARERVAERLALQAACKL